MLEKEQQRRRAIWGNIVKQSLDYMSAMLANRNLVIGMARDEIKECAVCSVKIANLIVAEYDKQFVNKHNQKETK